MPRGDAEDDRTLRCDRPGRIQFPILGNCRRREHPWRRGPGRRPVARLVSKPAYRYTKPWPPSRPRPADPVAAAGVDGDVGSGPPGPVLTRRNGNLSQNLYMNRPKIHAKLTRTGYTWEIISGQGMQTPSFKVNGGDQKGDIPPSACAFAVRHRPGARRRLEEASLAGVYIGRHWFESGDGVPVDRAETERGAEGDAAMKRKRKEEAWKAGYRTGYQDGLADIGNCKGAGQDFVEGYD